MSKTFLLTTLIKFSLAESGKENLINVVNKKVFDIKKLSERVHNELENYHSYKEELTEKISDLQVNIVRNETHIKVQNKTLHAIQEEVKDTLSKINLEEFEKKSHKLSKKIKHLEEVFEKFNEKEILTEGLLNEPPNVKNEDPLTPLDKNFVTLEQLQEHYRLFVNRIQQQLATFGGGGETRLEFLDDVDRNSAKQDGYVLQYNSSTGKFIGTSYVASGGGNVAIAITNVAPTNPSAGNLWYDLDLGRTFLYYTDQDGSQWVDANPSGTSSSGVNYWGSTNAGIYTTGNVAIGTNVVSTGSTALWVQGDARITGILSVGQGTITINGNTNTISAIGINASGIVTGSSFRPSSGYYQSANGTNSFYVYDGTGNVAFQGTIGASQINSASGYKALDFSSSTTPSVNITNGLNVGTGGTIITTTGIGSVGVGTTAPTAKFDIRGDMRVGVNTSQGVILTSPNGTKYRLIVSDAGVLSTVLVP